MKHLAWVLALLFSFSLFGCLDRTRFQGGRLVKGSYFSDPRYVAEFQELDLNENGRYSVRFRGFPASPASLYLELTGFTVKQSESISRYTPEVSVELVTDGGTRLCRAEGRLNSGHAAVNHAWVFSYSTNSAEFLNSDCLDLKIDRDQSYALHITVRDAMKQLGPLRAHPLLTGGGRDRHY